MTEPQTTPPTYTYVIINNIPKDYHSSDLRRFFSQAIETACFKCFHFRHRPEIKINKNDETENSESSKTSSSRCCIVVMKGDRFAGFRKRYHMKHWLMKNGEPMAQRCFIAEISVQDDSEGAVARTDSAASPDHPSFTRSDLQRLPELHPPAVMPCGNVGTPSSVFLQLIKECRLPASVIGKLGLTFAREKRKGRFSAVPPVHGDFTVEGAAAEIMEEEEAEKEEEEDNDKVETDTPTAEETNEDKSSSEDEDGTLEEWERHEALHADEFERSRTKERLYEEKIELKWEKGGSGLVFYTDTYRWKQDEGDFDEQTADDWDVDISGYYDSDPEAGDKDSRDYVSMRRSDRRRRGEQCEDDTAFSSGKVGRFERHTKGIGRKVLESQGWREGSGLGASSSGMADALGNDGQPAHVKTGFGYRGEKLNRYPVRKPTNDILISTIYDNPDRLVKTDTLYRRHGETVSNMTFKTDAYGVTSRRATSVTSGSEAGFVRPTEGK